MNSKKNLFVCLLGLTLLLSCGQKKNMIVSYSNNAIAYSGRMDSTSGDGIDLYWSGSSIKINFKGDSIFATLKDASGDNYFNIILDSDSIRILRVDTIMTRYLLAENLAKGPHSIELFKRGEWDRGNTTFYQFEISGEAKVLPRVDKKRSIEFFGDSITAGYAVDDESGGDSPDSVYTNNYVSYAAITARNFDADYQCICKGGIGIMVSWFPLIMPEMYDRLIPDDSTSQWDFTKYTPDVVVINVFQNDSWLVDQPTYPEFISRFGTDKLDEEFIIDAYQQFISSVRNKYPEASIICALGNMDATQEGSPWFSYIQQAVTNLSDDKLYAHYMPYKNTNGHPNREEQQIMANSLTNFINENIAW